MSNIKRNLGLQTAFQILNTCLPLITAPYLARRLGVSQLGVFSYTTSVVAYFALIAMLGTVNYGTRSIASVKEDKESRSRTFWGIFALQLGVTLFSICAYLVYLLFFCRENQLIAWIQAVTLLACLFDINWFFFGIEEFKITVTRSMIIRILTVAAILLLVKKPGDLWAYTLIMLGGTLLSQMILFVYLPRYVSWVRIGWEDVRRHIRPNLSLFVPLLAMSVYHTMDKTMLGRLSTYEQSGFYYNSDKVVNIPMSVINGIGTVMLPRMSNLISGGKRKEADDLFIKTLEGVAVVSVAMACGIAAVAREFIPVFYGAGYEPCILLTQIFTPILVIKSFSLIARTQYLIPMNLEREFTKSVCVGALVNLVLNLLLIPRHGALGAVVATLIAELAACAVQFLSLRGKGLPLAGLFGRTACYGLMGLAMICTVRAAATVPGGVAVKLIAEIAVGAAFYACACLLFWKKTKNELYSLLVLPALKRRSGKRDG